MQDFSSHIVPVILCGGGGARLWPASRKAKPKQFLKFGGEHTLFQQTVLRFGDNARYTAPVVVCARDHVAPIQQQLEQIGTSAAYIIVEPLGRNTAPAAAVAAQVVAEKFPGAQLFLLPSDHIITNAGVLHTAVQTVQTTVAKGGLVTFGVVPSLPETGYGYILAGHKTTQNSSVYAVEKFIEKPDMPSARNYVIAGGYYWNSGMFLFMPDVFLQELKSFAHKMATACAESVALCSWQDNVCYLHADSFAASPGDSIDYAVMEHTHKAFVIPVSEIGWSDVGSWNALFELAEKDDFNNVVYGEQISHRQTTGCYIRAGKGLKIAVSGLHDMAVVAENNCVLVVPRNESQDVKKLVDDMIKKGEYSHL